MKKQFGKSLGLYCLITIYSMSVYAQNPPDAGSILRETEKKAVEVIKEEPTIYEAPKAKQVKKGETIRILGFKFTGIRVIPEIELKRLLKDFVGRNVDVGELDLITGKVSEYYAKKNYIVKVIVPEQEVKNGIIEIKVIMGRLEDLITSGKKKRFNQKIAIRIVNNAQHVGKIIKIDRLERGMLLLNDTPGVQARALLCPGDKEGGVIVDLNMKDMPLLSGSIGYDDFGLHSTGTQRGTVSARLNDPFGIGDQFTGSFIYTGLMGYESLVYSLPIGYSGMRMGLTTSYLDYRLGKEFSGMQGKGNAMTVGPYISYPLIRSRSKNMYILVNFHHKKFVNEILGNRINNKKADVGNINLNADSYDKFLGGGYTMGGIGFALGNLNLKGNQADYTADNDGPRTHGVYSKFVFLGSRIQRITDTTSLNLKISGQVALHNLDTSEQFSLGGPDGVRAYSPGEAYGDHGVVGALELSRRLWNGFRVEGFYDLGYTRQRFKTYEGWQLATNKQKNGYALDAVGMSLCWEPKTWFSAKISAATAALLRNNDIGAGQDFRAGLGKYSRVWLQVTAAI